MNLVLIVVLLIFNVIAFIWKRKSNKAQVQVSQFIPGDRIYFENNTESPFDKDVFDIGDEENVLLWGHSLTRKFTEATTVKGGVRDINMACIKGKITSVVGLNGAGKSVLLSILGDLIRF